MGLLILGAGGGDSGTGDGQTPDATPLDFIATLPTIYYYLNALGKMLVTGGAVELIGESYGEVQHGQTNPSLRPPFDPDDQGDGFPAWLFNGVSNSTQTVTPPTVGSWHFFCVMRNAGTELNSILNQFGALGNPTGHHEMLLAGAGANARPISGYERTGTLLRQGSTDTTIPELFNNSWQLLSIQYSGGGAPGHKMQRGTLDIPLSFLNIGTPSTTPVSQTDHIGMSPVPDRPFQGATFAILMTPALSNADRDDVIAALRDIWGPSGAGRIL